MELFRKKKQCCSFSIPLKEYQTVISSLETLSLADEKLVTLPVVKGRLMDEEARLGVNGMNRNKEESSAVFVANAKSKPKQFSKHFQYSPTNRQLSESHSQVKQFGKVNRPNDFKFNCHFCQKPGHKKGKIVGKEKSG